MVNSYRDGCSLYSEMGMHKFISETNMNGNLIYNVTKSL